MPLYDFFRRAFGPTTNGPGQSGFRNPIWEEESDDDEDELDDEFSGDIMDMHKYFEQQMEEMLKNFHSSLFGSDLLQLPKSGFHESIQEKDDEVGPNRYLKPWFDTNVDENVIKQDTDIDGRITSGDLKKFFSNEEEQRSITQVPKSIFGQSVITRIVRTADGRLEEEKRVRGSDGREEISLTRQIGDQKYKVITKKDKQSGVTDTTEELINLDQEKLDEFNRKWSENKPSTSSKQDSKQKIVPLNPSADNTNITRLFEKWFK